MKNIGLILIAILLFSACEDILEEHPKSIASETFYNTRAEVEAAVNAIYPPLHGGEFVSYFTHLTPCADYVYGRGSIGSINAYQGFNTTNIGNMRRVWDALYLSIRNANLVIKHTPQGSNTTDGEKAQYIAEARFMRALDYFFLVRLWAGVPLRTEETMNELDIPRSSVDDVYKLIIDDLKYAENNLPDSPRLLGTPSKWTAKTLFADVYLFREEWANARDKADEVIKSGKYSLVEVIIPDDFEKIYGADVLTTSEEIFYFKYNDESGWALMNFFHHPSDGYKPYGSNWYSFYSTTDNYFYKNWDDNDFRKQHVYYSCDIGLGDNTLLFKKYIDPNGTVNASNDWPIYRYAELLLIYAEAANNANNGPTEFAVECLNSVHRRAYGYNPESPSPVDFEIGDYDKDSFFELVFKERGYETLMESKRWLDLVRTGKAAEVIKETEGIDLDESMYLWPIPISETNYNKAIDPIQDQNPGY
ncbi:RagB/SusD family nutrient uptake outer membrane protein [Maribellus maritimus]|uniref:RagB/SusD family nutrient uptake outer membrane protein n=1 Tax=Maribellus maritimus TaxID=2870838 RepID=UPI001EEA484F|nr:RagB/SusD family nutrient uptake outer membrane protein [Maribellus maritimus]MCG6189703.1 RagB/SusD family nutrient uptake outer membrane protein [Maribellus maritimus]